jgi:hypothetical protein
MCNEGRGAETMQQDFGLYVAVDGGWCEMDWNGGRG